jgi:hypothetical protein
MSDRHGTHKDPTISFRASSYEREQIDQRVYISGQKKRDYIVHSCIYNHVVVVGAKDTVKRIRRQMKELYSVLNDVSDSFAKQEKVLTEEGLNEMAESYQAFLDAMIWMLEGARYIWEGVDEDGER